MMASGGKMETELFTVDDGALSWFTGTRSRGARGP